MFKLTFYLLIGIFTMSVAQQKDVINTADKFIIRTGVNVSHWLSQSERRGEERRQYITKRDFDTIAVSGFDHVRIPVDEEQLWDSTGKKDIEAFGLLHHAVQWAINANLRVIVDLHIIRSHYFNAENNALWTNPAEQEKLVTMWKELSQELVQYPVSTVAYEILNEAVANNPEDWNNLLKKVITALRVKEPNRIIVVGSNMWQIPDTFPFLKIPEGDRNIILSFHFYTPMALTHHKASWAPFAEYSGPVNYPGQTVDTANYKGLSQATVDAMRNFGNGFFTKETLEHRMAPAIKIAKQHKLPLYCGEFGVYPTIPEATMLRWYKDMCEVFNKNGIAYCHWCYKGDFPVVDVKTSAPNKKLVSVLTAKKKSK